MEYTCMLLETNVLLSIENDKCNDICPHLFIWYMPSLIHIMIYALTYSYNICIQIGASKKINKFNRNYFVFAILQYGEISGKFDWIVSVVMSCTHCVNKEIK